MLGDCQTGPGLAGNVVPLISELMARPELIGVPTVRCGSFTEATIPNGEPGSFARASN